MRARSSAWIERLPSKFEESRKSWDRSPPGPPPFNGWSKENIIVSSIAIIYIYIALYLLLSLSPNGS